MIFYEREKCSREIRSNNTAGNETKPFVNRVREKIADWHLDTGAIWETQDVHCRDFSQGELIDITWEPWLWWKERSCPKKGKTDKILSVEILGDIS